MSYALIVTEGDLKLQYEFCNMNNFTNCLKYLATRTTINHQIIADAARYYNATLQPRIYNPQITATIDITGLLLRNVTLSMSDGYQGPLYMYSKKDYKQYLNKVVKFHYEGGSEVGNRIVKVDDIQYKNGHYLLTGTDLIQDEIRAYRSDKISSLEELKV